MPTPAPSFDFSSYQKQLADLTKGLVGSLPVVNPTVSVPHFDLGGIGGGISGILPGPGSGPGVGTGGNGGLFTSFPPIAFPGSGTGSGSGSGSGSGGAATSSTVGVLGTAASLFACFTSPTSCLLRLVLLIIGLICIIGAIYLFKPTNNIVAPIVNVVHAGVKHVAKAAAESVAE